MYSSLHTLFVVVLSVNRAEGWVEVTRVKSSKEGGGKESYKRVKTWNIDDLRCVDGHRLDSTEFDLTFDRTTFKWIASNVSDKKVFVTQLYKVYHLMFCV